MSSPEPAGYSGTPLPKKLGIKPGHRIRLIGAPEGFGRTLGELPRPVEVVAGDDEGGARLDLVLFFTDSADALRTRFDALAASLTPAGMLWVAWPKKASKVPTDITEDTVREVFLPLGLVDNKVCAVNEIWSGLRVVWRKENRASRRAGGEGPPG
jgi:hypothetical protein